MSDRTIIGIDIGGTNIDIGKIRNEQIIDEISICTGTNRPENHITNDIIDGVARLFDSSVSGIGVGVPGLVDSKNGIVYNLTNIPSWKEVHLKEILEKKFNVQVIVGNDANCFALGVKTFGKGKNISNLIGVTLGTGLGIGIIIRDYLYTGKISIAGEIAGIQYLESNFENYCSSKFFKYNYNKTSKEIFDQVHTGSSEAQRIYNEFGNHLGNLIRTLILAYGPDAIIFGGSVSKAFEVFYPAIQDNLKEFPHQNVLQDLIITKSLHDKIPLLGAAALVLDSKKNNKSYEAYSHEKD
jgi:glucokinase